MKNCNDVSNPLFHTFVQEPPPLVSLDEDPQDDNGIEVIEEIPGPRCPFQIRKNLYPTGHISNVNI